MIALAALLALGVRDNRRLENERRNTVAAHGETLKAHSRTLAQKHENLVNMALATFHRGDFRTALRSFDDAIAEGFPDRVQLEIERVWIRIALNQRDQAERELARLERRNDLGGLGARVLLQRGDLELSEPSRQDEGRALIRRAFASGGGSLSPAESAYAEGRLAGTSMEAIGYFEKALQAEPFHHRAHAVLLTSLLTAGRFDEARDQSRLMRAVFNDDMVPTFADAWIALLEGNPKASLEGIERLRTSLGDAKTVELRAYFTLFAEIRDILEGLDLSQTGLPLKDAMRFLAKLNEFKARYGRNGFLGPVGFGVPAVAWRWNTMEMLPVAVWNLVLKPDQLAERLARINEEQPEALFLFLSGLSHLVRATRIRDDEAAQIREANEAVRWFRRASEAPTVLPSFRYFERLVETEVEAEILRQDKGQANPRLTDRVSRNIGWLLVEGNERPTQHARFLPDALQLLEPDVGRVLLSEWQRNEPDNLGLVRARARLELRAGDPLSALRAALRVLEQRPDDAEILKVREQAQTSLREAASKLATP